MPKRDAVKNLMEKAIFIVPDLQARIQACKKKNISLAHLPMLMAHSKVLSQNMKNFTALYGSRWEAIKKMDQITGGNVKSR